MSRTSSTSGISNACNRYQSGSMGAICDEHLLQYAHPGNEGTCDIIIGLDFGTSASKVVIHVPTREGSPSYVVDFGQFSHRSAEYLLPTQMWITPEDVCHLNYQNNARSVNDIKLDLISEGMNLKSNRGPSAQGMSPEEIAVAYLALMLRYVRRWFLETKLDIVGHYKTLIWSLNMGVPSPCIEDNEANRCFRRVGKAAWMLSTLEGEITVERARMKLKYINEAPESWERDDDGLACDFDIIPEIVAGAVGYSLSDIRREGLHVMVDVGASTVDVCSFVLHANGYSLLTADVQLLGTIRLHFDRILSLKRAYEKQAENLRDTHDPVAPIAEDIEQYLIPREKLINMVDLAEANLKLEFQKMVRRVIWDARCHRDPNAAVWLDGRLPILLVGGGSELQFFLSAVKEFDGWLKRYASVLSRKYIDKVFRFLPGLSLRLQSKQMDVRICYNVAHIARFLQ